jgi:hypothetical protein
MIDKLIESVLKESYHDSKYLALAKSLLPTEKASRGVYATLLMAHEEVVIPEGFGSGFHGVNMANGDIWEYMQRFAGALPFLPADDVPVQRKMIEEWMWSLDVDSIQDESDVPDVPFWGGTTFNQEVKAGVVAYARLRRSHLA